MPPSSQPCAFRQQAENRSFLSCATAHRKNAAKASSTTLRRAACETGLKPHEEGDQTHEADNRGQKRRRTAPRTAGQPDWPWGPTVNAHECAGGELKIKCNHEALRLRSPVHQDNRQTPWYKGKLMHGCTASAQVMGLAEERTIERPEIDCLYILQVSPKTNKLSREIR